MSKFGRDKIALVLACASIFGGKTQAAQNVKTGQTVAAVGGATFDNSKALKKSKSMSNLTKGLIIGGSILGAGLIGYEVLGDIFIDKAPTLLKLIRGRKQGKDEQVAKENMQKIDKEMNDLEEFKKEGIQQYKGSFLFFKKKFESIKELIMNYKSNDIWCKIISVTDGDNKYVTNEKEVPSGLSEIKLFKSKEQKKNFNSRLMEKFASIFNGGKKIKECKKIIGGIEIYIDEEFYSIIRDGNELILSNYTVKDNKKENFFEIEYLAN